MALHSRTWHYLMVIGKLSFALLFVQWFVPEDSPLRWLSVAAFVWWLLCGLLGALHGVLMLFGKCHMGCPLCDSNAQLLGGDNEGFILRCPECGDVCAQVGRLSGLKAWRLEDGEHASDEEDEETEEPETSTHLLSFPIRRPGWALAFLLPVVASIIAASLIHRFSFFYLFIPGAWCYFVTCFFIQAFCTGQITDNHGTARRSRSPFRFWFKFGIWVLGYLFALSFPILFAKQEHAKVSKDVIQLR
jgi:hypothetical protein